jgi:predicted nucleic acid-binding protein
VTGLVIDASIVLAWYFADEISPPPSFMERLVAGPIVVPTHFEAELANGVVVGERRGRASPDQAAELVMLMKQLAPERDGEGSLEALARILPLARAHRLTVYDTLYLELAERRGLPLATRDADLSEAAASVGIEVLVE